MKIYLDDGFAAGHGGGIGVYSEIIYTELAEKGMAVTRAKYPKLEKIKNTTLRRLLYSLYLNFMLPAYLRKNKFAIAHFTNVQIPSRKNGFTKYVSTIHDLNPILFPYTVPSLYAKFYRKTIRNVIRNADCVITVSESVQKAILGKYNLPASKVRICKMGLRESFYKSSAEHAFLNKHNLAAKNYFLFVGRLEKRKNLVMLAMAFSGFKKATNSSLKLVLAGTPGFGFAELNTTILASEFKDDIIVTGYVSLENLKTLYANAGAFILPSLNEGFGIPLIEAMQFGLPLILSDIETNREIVGAKAVYFDKDDIAGLQNILIDFSRNSRPAVNYSEILMRYTVENMISSHLEVYNNLRR